MKNIVVIGSANMDTTHYVVEFPTDLTSECINNVEDVIRVLGGKGANQAVSASLQSEGTDNKVYFIGCVGQDESGVEILKKFKESNINYFGVEVLKDTSTDGRIIFVDKDGNNKMLGYGNCVKQLLPSIVFNEKNKPIMDQADIVMLQMKMPDETTEKIIEFCNQSGKVLLIDPTPIEKSSLLAKKGLIDNITYLTPNEEEAYALAMYEMGYDLDTIKEHYSKSTEENKMKIIRALVEKHPNVIATLGSKGVMYNNNGVKVQKPYTDKCIDSTGAGDTFNGAFIGAIARGESLESAIDYAMVDCAHKVKYKGAQNGMQTYKETKRDLDRLKTL